MTRSRGRLTEGGRSILALASVLVSVSALAKPINYPDPQALWKDSDLVCKARTTDATNAAFGGSVFTSRHEEKVEFGFEYAFKGELASKPLVVRVQFDDMDATLWAPAECQILFLKRREDGTYIPTEPYNSQFAVSSKPVGRPPADASGETERQALSRLWNEFAGAARDTSLHGGYRRSAILPLVELAPDDGALSALVVELSAEEVIGYWALRTRVERQDGSAIAYLVKLLESKDPEDLKLAGRFDSSLEDVRDPAHVDLLARAVEAGREEAAAAACFALGKIESDRTVPVLVKTLDSKFPKAAFWAVLGLWQHETNDPKFKQLPGTDYNATRERFDEDPDMYLNNWRNWWAMIGKEKYAHVLAEKGNPSSIGSDHGK